MSSRSSDGDVSKGALFLSCKQNIYIIDQARGQDGWILASFSFCVFMDRDEVEVHKDASHFDRTI